MSYLITILITLVVVIPISWLWVKGIDTMKKKYPNYKGKDFLNWDNKNDEWDKTRNTGGRDDWDKISHTEGDF